MKKLLTYIYNYIHFRLFKIRPFSFLRKKDRVTLPKDDGYLSHEDVQWWYWTGHLEGENGEKFGFELVFFVFNSWIVFKNTLAQAAISDITNNTYKFREKVEFLKLPKKIPSKFQLIADEGKDVVISANGGNGEDELFFKVEGYEVKLSLKELSKPVIHYDGEKHKYSFGGGTYYYARESMTTTGTVIKDGKEIKVKGVSWFDRQYGELYQAIFKGWQWFAIELNDGISIMIYDFRDEKNSAESFGSITKNSFTSNITNKEFVVEALSTWTSPHTQIVYPASWKLTVGERDYYIYPSIADQELRAQHHIWIGPEYWEGACIVKDKVGNVLGQAYVELNGYSRHKIITIDIDD